MEIERAVVGVTGLRHYIRGLAVVLGHGGEGEFRKGSAPLRGIKFWGSVSAAAGVTFFAGTVPAQAYLDPGTGSIVLQAVIGAVAGGLVAARIYWGRIKSFLKRKKGGASRDDRFTDRK